jgi:hypothetical protein
MNEIELDFELNGLELRGGWRFCGPITGRIDVSFNRGGQWWIDAIYLDIEKRVGGMLKQHRYLLDKTKADENEWFHRLRPQIASTHKDYIDENVAEALADVRVYARAGG